MNEDATRYEKNRWDLLANVKFIELFFGCGYAVGSSQLITADIKKSVRFFRCVCPTRIPRWHSLLIHLNNARFMLNMTLFCFIESFDDLKTCLHSPTLVWPFRFVNRVLAIVNTASIVQAKKTNRNKKKSRIVNTFASFRDNIFANVHKNVGYGCCQSLSWWMKPATTNNDDDDEVVDNFFAFSLPHCFG